jgi:hypothetical protein
MTVAPAHWVATFKQCDAFERDLVAGRISTPSRALPLSIGARSA